MSILAVRSIQSETLNIPLTEPFGISGGAQHEAKNVLVAVTLENGEIGYGEGAPLPPYNGETQEITLEAINQISSQLLGMNVKNWRDISEILRESIPHSGSARCAIETAVLDALTRSQGRPFWSLFGESKATIETDMTITTQPGLSADEAINHALSSTISILERGIRIIKTKVGGDLELDIRRLEAIHSKAPNSPLILDGNGAFTADEALQFLDRLAKVGVVPDIFEQPVKGSDIMGLKKVKDNGGIPVAADESVKDLESAQRVIDEKAATIVNIKIMKCGPVEGYDIAVMCKKAGLDVMIGGNVESILAMTASAHISYGSGLISHHDLDTPAWMRKNPFSGGFLMEGGQITLDHIEKGHGVTPIQRS